MGNLTISKTHLIQSLLGIFLLLIIGTIYVLGKRQVVLNTKSIETPIVRATSSKEICRGDTTKQQVIFTFDAGDGIQSGENILVVLAKHHVRGTFFMTGKFIESNPSFVRRAVAAGHEIFNHTYDHPHLSSIGDEEIVHELNRMDVLLFSTTMGIVSTTSSNIPHSNPPSVSARPYFRAPFGDRDARVLDIAFREGYRSVYWTVDARDWEESNGISEEEVTSNLISNLSPGNIYLMHVGDGITGKILDRVFTTIEEKGYKIVSLTEGI